MDRTPASRAPAVSFAQLVGAVTQTQDRFVVLAGKAVNVSLTLRNWVRALPTKALVEGLSFTHFAELLALPDGPQRAFYELECLRGNWSVRELKRQIASLLYERLGLSTDRKQLIARVHAAADAFDHHNIGQLNTYVSWYGKHMRAPGDGPPIGILLCTRKDHALVEYALAGMDNQLFVSRYQLELPTKEEMQRFLEEQLSQLDTTPAHPA